MNTSTTPRKEAKLAQWRALTALFEEVCAIPAEQRDDYLASMALPSATRAKLERMLATLHQTISLLDTPLTDRITVNTEAYAEQWVGKTVNGFIFDRLLHAGNIAGVFLASQKEPVERQVVIKMMRPEVSSEMKAFFEFEQQSLARLSHPNIATIHTVEKSPEGLSFIVMEYIEGNVLADYCDRQLLSIRERLELFLQICDAISYSHQRGILHRDLKSSNILVRDFEGKPTPTIIDFGISSDLNGKVRLDDDNVLGTPEYMSPEHVLNTVELDARADVYSLGMVLFAVLTGRIPFDRTPLLKLSPAQRLTLIAEFEVPAPSAYFRALPADKKVSIARTRGATPQALARRLGSELDAIYQKATLKDRDRRYASVADLAEDIRRHLRHQTVSARPTSALYHIRKFIRRNVIASAAGAILLLSGAVFVATLVEQNRTIKAEAEKARLEKRNAEEVTAMIMQTIGFADPTGASSTGVASAPEMLNHGYENLLKTKGLSAAVRVELMLSLSEAFRGIGDIEKAKEIDYSLVADAADIAPALMCNVYLSAAQTAEKDAAFSLQLDFAREAVSSCSAAGFKNESVVASTLAVAQAYTTTADFVQARATGKSALDLYTQQFDGESQLLVDIYQMLGNVEAFTGNFGDAKGHFETSLQIARRLYSADHAIPVAAETKLLQLLCHVQDPECAEERIKKQLDLVTRVRGEDSAQVSHVLSILSHHYLNNSDSLRGAQTLTRNLALMEKRGEQYQPRYLANRGNLFFSHINSGRYEEARDVAAGTYRLATETNESGQSLSPYRRALAFQWYARALFATDEPHEAFDLVTKAADLFENIPGGNRSNVRKTRLIRALIAANLGNLDVAKRDIAWLAEQSPAPPPDSGEQLMFDGAASFINVLASSDDSMVADLRARWDAYTSQDGGADVAPPFSTIARYIDQVGR